MAGFWILGTVLPISRFEFPPHILIRINFPEQEIGIVADFFWLPKARIPK